MTDSTAIDHLTRTRLALHVVAEALVAGPQYAAHQDIRLAVDSASFRGWVPDAAAVAGTELVTPHGRHPIRGRLSDLAAAAGVVPRRLDDVYHGGLQFADDEPLDVDPVATDRILAAFAAGDAALRRLDATQRPILWPEHFDVGITVDEVNYGVSPGDAGIAVPYAYVGPWRVPTGEFWDRPFGAALPLPDGADADQVLDFFLQGRRHLP